MKSNVPKRSRHLLAAIGVAAASWAAPAWAAPTLFLDYEVQQGLVFPDDLACLDPFAGCTMRVVGSGVGTLSGEATLSSQWGFAAFLTLAADPSLPAGQWLAIGGFAYQEIEFDGSLFMGGYVGVFDQATFTASLDFTVDGQSVTGGFFGGRAGTGRSTITITPGSGPGGDEFHYREVGRFAFEPTPTAQVPVPATSALAALGLLLAGVTSTQRPRRSSGPDTAGSALPAPTPERPSGFGWGTA